MKSWPRLGISIILLAIISLACRFSANNANLSANQTALSPNPTIDRTLIVFPPTETPQPPSPTRTLTPAQTVPAATPTETLAPPVPTVSGPVPATTTVLNVKLRSGPGSLFSSINPLPNGAKISVLGKARGDDWVYVDSGLGKGWLSIAFTSLAGDPVIAALPLIDTGTSVVVQGRVVDPKGAPVSGVEFAVFQGREESKPPVTQAHTLADGSFFAYLPQGASGVWRISLTTVDCKSRAVDASCTVIGIFVPRFTDVTLPGSQIAEFTYLSP